MGGWALYVSITIVFGGRRRWAVTMPCDLFVFSDRACICDSVSVWWQSLWCGLTVAFDWYSDDRWNPLVSVSSEALFLMPSDKLSIIPLLACDDWWVLFGKILLLGCVTWVMGDGDRVCVYYQPSYYWYCVSPIDCPNLLILYCKLWQLYSPSLFNSHETVAWQNRHVTLLISILSILYNSSTA